jgi:hypothetical protein
MALFLSKWLFLVLSFGLFSTKKKPDANMSLHPFYVSVTEVAYNTTEKSLEVSCKFFADDFEHVLEKAYKVQLDISAEKDKPLFNKFIQEYINKHFGITADGKAVKLNYIGCEKDKESVYCYFEVTNLAAVKRLDMVNNLLYDLTQEQINIMHVTVNSKRQSSKLNFPETKAAFQF